MPAPPPLHPPAPFTHLLVLLSRRMAEMYCPVRSPWLPLT